MITDYVLDATMGCKDGLFCFCPIEGDINGDFTVITGLNLISSSMPERGKVVAIVHADGQNAVEKFCAEYAPELEALQKLDTSDESE